MEPEALCTVQICFCSYITGPAKDEGKKDRKADHEIDHCASHAPLCPPPAAWVAPVRIFPTVAGAPAAVCSLVWLVLLCPQVRHRVH